MSPLALNSMPEPHVPVLQPRPSQEIDVVIAVPVRSAWHGVLAFGPVHETPGGGRTLPSIQPKDPCGCPGQTEAGTTKPVRKAVNGSADVKLGRSLAVEGLSSVFVEFRLDTDMIRAMQDVRDKVALVRPTFPRDATDPFILRADDETQETATTGTLVFTSEAGATSNVGSYAIDGSGLSAVPCRRGGHRVGPAGLGGLGARDGPARWAWGGRVP